jgi:large subunit ribosomal protein L3
MPGRMGTDRVTVQNLRVVKIDEELKVLLVKGAVPGPAQGVVIVRKAKKK